jgi:hypothetical protein
MQMREAVATEKSSPQHKISRYAQNDKRCRKPGSALAAGLWINGFVSEKKNI